MYVPMYLQVETANRLQLLFVLWGMMIYDEICFGKLFQAMAINAYPSLVADHRENAQQGERVHTPSELLPIHELIEIDCIHFFGSKHPHLQR